MEGELSPIIGELTPVEVEILDSTLPAIALGDDTPLLNALEAIVRTRLSRDEIETYERLPPDEKGRVLDKARSQIPLLARG